MQNKIYAYTIQLGRNMWSDKTGPVEIANYLQVFMPKYETFNKDKETFRKLVDHAASVGMNTIVINIGEGLTYESHPEINIDGSWTKKELKEEIDHIRKLGLEPVPMLNFSAAHDVWLGKYERMVSTKKYYEVCGDLIDEVCELFECPKYFHIGMDEENPEAQVSYNFATVRNELVFCRDVNFFCDRIRKHGARPWMFSDSCLRFPEGFTSSIGKDVIMSNQQICFMCKLEEITNHLILPTELETLAKSGYDIVMMTTCYRRSTVPAEAVDYAKKHLPADKVKGMICMPFLFCEQENYYKLLYEASATSAQIGKL